MVKIINYFDCYVHKLIKVTDIVFTVIHLIKCFVISIIVNFHLLVLMILHYYDIKLVICTVCYFTFW